MQASLHYDRCWFCYLVTGEPLGAIIPARQIISLDDIIVERFRLVMIESFRCRETEKVFNRVFSRKLPKSMQRIALRKLWMLDAATELETLQGSPNNRHEALKGKRKAQHSIRINDPWRICFRWCDSDAHNVEIVDYHLGYEL